MRGYEDVIHPTVHDDGIDFAYIARLESDARSGAPAAIDKFAAAQHVAAQFLLAKGDTDSAISQYRQALIFAPNNTGLLLNLSVLYLRQSQFTSALDELERAHRLTPDTDRAAADIAKLLGWAYSGANKLTRPSRNGSARSGCAPIRRSREPSKKLNAIKRKRKSAR